MPNQPANLLKPAAPPDAPGQKADWDAWARGACAEIAAKIDAQLKPKAGEFAELVVKLNTEIARLTHMVSGNIGRDWRSGQRYILPEKGSVYGAVCAAGDALRAARTAILTLTARLEQAEWELHGWRGAAQSLSAANAKLREAAQEACDLLAERKHGSPARSPGHNARLVLQEALSHSPSGGDDT